MGVGAVVLVTMLEVVAEVLPEVAAAVAGNDESLTSVVYLADKPVTFLQELGGLSAEPATKLTVEHCCTEIVRQPANFHLQQELHLPGIISRPAHLARPGLLPLTQQMYAVPL